MFIHIRRSVALTLAIMLITLVPLHTHAAENDGLASDFGGFGIGGIMASAPISINKIALQTDGKVVAVGVRGNTFAAARYNSDGTIDSSFGTSGFTVTTIAAGQQSAVANDVALQPDGKIVAVGTLTTPGDHDFAVVRYNTNGTLDTSFSDNGILYAGFDGKADYASGVGIDSYGRIIVGGTARVGGDDDFAVMSLTTDGLFDSGFGGGDGRATIGFGDDETAFDLFIQPDDRIVVVGDQFYTFFPGGWTHYFAVARLNPNGSLDGSFDGDGKRTSDVGIGYGKAGALDSNGRIVAVGLEFDTVRYNPNGSHDQNFDGDGKLSPPISKNSAAYAVVTLPDDKILAAGYIGDQMALLRYNFNGTLDQSFEGDGVLLLDSVPNYAETAYSMVRTPDGRLLLAGGYLIVRLFADGTLDSGGRQLAAPVPEPQVLNRVANATLAQPDGAIINVGWVHRGNFDYDIALTRHTATGLPDPTFGTNGERTLGFGATFEISNDAVLQPDGKIVVVGSSQVDAQDDTNVLLARFKADGSSDGSCALFGLTIKDFFGNSQDVATNVALQPDGKILVAGMVAANGAGANPYVARFNTDCGLDTTFSDDGIAPLGFGSTVADVLILPDGKVMLVGTAPNVAYLARYSANGVLDISFGGDGLVTTLLGQDSGINAAAIQPTTGKILIAGQTSSQGQYDFIVIRYNTDGTIDSSFGVDGRRDSHMADSEYLHGLAVREDGAIALAGCALTSGIALVALYSADGTPDSALSGDGISTFAAGGFTCLRDAVFSNGRLIVGGHASNGTTLSFALAVYPLASGGGGGDGRTSRTLSFVAASGDTFAENAISAMLTVSLSQTAAQTVTVQYAASGGTATNGADYTLASGTLTFAPGQTSQRIGLMLTNDTDSEPDETLVVTLSSPTNAVLGNDASVTLTIADDDSGRPLPEPNPLPNPSDPGSYRSFIPLVRR